MPPDGTRCASLTAGPDASPYDATRRRNCPPKFAPTGSAGAAAVKLMPAMAGDSDGCRMPGTSRRLPVARTVPAGSPGCVSDRLLRSRTYVSRSSGGSASPGLIGADLRQLFGYLPFVHADRVSRALHRDGRSPACSSRTPAGACCTAERRLRPWRCPRSSGRPVRRWGCRSPRRLLRLVAQV